eukprot:TRINITY_DN76337_c0_g1_i1.p1 TRINITY_DN76337_c0_g1~~TRINITY_DN76337_c0_g1_i1.p1  ORF type:complete len:394 (-),score=48.09 TRINITY_DN76337_c0_g1_i1:181-1362(-)
MKRTSAACISPTDGYLGRCRSVEIFEKLNRLGEGTYGTVYRARDKESNTVVALKKVRIHSEKDGFPRSSLREIRILRRLKHPNIVELKEVVCGAKLGSVFLVFEYCEHDVGALLDLMERPFGQAEVKCLVLQLLQAVEHLHKRFIIHRDIKLSNLLLNNKGVLKLADFGLAREFEDPAQPCTTKVVTLWYRSPELLLGAKLYTTAVDIWSIGCNFGELIAKRPLLPGKAEEHQLHLVCELLGTPSPKIWPGLNDLPLFSRFVLPSCDYNNLRVKFPEAPDSCLELLNRMLTFDPAKRATASACLQHRYFLEAPAPQEPQWMPTWREHRNFTNNPRALGSNAVPLAGVTSAVGLGGSALGTGGTVAAPSGKRQLPLAASSAFLAATKKIRTSVF